jgi:carbonic anhydrase
VIAVHRLAIVAAIAAVLGAPAGVRPAMAMVDKPAPRKLAKPGDASPAVQAPAPAASVPLAGDDAMERLRQRLSERLAGPGGAAASGTLDLQIAPRVPAAPRQAVASPAAGAAPAPAVAAPPPAAPAALHAPAHRAAGATAATALPSAAGAAAARRTAHGHAAATGGHGAWGYEGVVGPAAWGGLRPDFHLCGNGQRQSPIDIRGGLAVELDAVRFDYKPTPFGVIDNGHTVQVNLSPGNAIEVGGRRYELVQFHFHRPSEERIDGRQFEMSLHLVHKDAAGKLAVVAVLLGQGPAHPAVQMVWNNLPLERHEEARARSPIDPGHLLPADKSYYTYMGSLTTPPCSEGVLWVVMRTPVTLAAEQLELFARIYPMNARPVQPVAGRRIMQSQ